MLSDESQRRIKAIKAKMEEVGETLGIPRDEAAALVIVDALEQNTQAASSRESGRGQVWAWFKGWISHGAETAKKIRID